MSIKKSVEQIETSRNVEEIVSAIFCSKRYTGQFEDSDSDIEVTIDAHEEASSSGADWTVHDFADSDEDSAQS